MWLVMARYTEIQRGEFVRSHRQVLEVCWLECPRGLPSRSPKEPAIGRGDVLHAIPAERAIEPSPECT
jgi:hypothetical protein